MQRDPHLIHELLAYLQKIEASKQPGDTSLPVQPHYEDVTVPGGFRIDGYTGLQIDDHLRLMIGEGLIVGQELAIGIHFDHLTPAGHALLNKP